MDLLTTEQIGQRIAKQTINKLNKKYDGWIFPKPKLEIVEIKGAFAQANNFNQTIKVSPRAFNVNTFTSGYKKEVKYIERNVTTLEQHIKWLMCHEYQHLLNSCDGHTNTFFNKVEKMYQTI